MIQKITGFKITGPELTEDRMAMSTTDRIALSENRRVKGLTTWDTDLEKFFFLKDNSGTLEWVEIEMGGDFAIKGEILVADSEWTKHIIYDEWTHTINMADIPFADIDRLPVVHLFRNGVLTHAVVETSATEVTIKVNEEIDLKYLIN
jgi:hypothetical protein